MSKPQLFLHIGTHKTGTTTLQNILANNFDLLKKEKIIYLGMYQAYLNDICELQDKNDPIVFNAKNKIHADIAKIKDFDKLIISNEKLSGEKTIGYKNSRFVAGCLKTITQDLDLDIKIIVFLRRQDDFIESLYTQRISNGEMCTFKEFVQSFDKDSFRWDTLLKSFEDTFGKENVIVRRYHKDFFADDNIVNVFGEIVESPCLINYEGSMFKNRGYSRSALELFRMVYPSLEANERRNLRKLLKQANPEDPFKNYNFFSYEERLNFLSDYLESNSQVSKIYFKGDYEYLIPMPLKNDKEPEFQELTTKDMVTNILKVQLLLNSQLLSIEKTVKQLNKKTFLEKVITKIKRLSNF